MKFAHWETLTLPTGLLLAPLESSEHKRFVGRDEFAKHFVVDIPEGTLLDDVVAKLAGQLGRQIDENDGLGFQHEWPAEVQRQFDTGSGERWSFLDLK